MNLARVSSSDGKMFVDVVERQSGFFGLECYEKKYDSEEDCEYVIRVLPDPDGVFENVESALVEANRLLAFWVQQ